MHPGRGRGTQDALAIQPLLWAARGRRRLGAVEVLICSAFFTLLAADPRGWPRLVIEDFATR